MGIPSYFSYIIKNHGKIIRNLLSMYNIKFHSLYMDCNSIIYDVFNTLIKDNPELSFDEIIENVITTIEFYVSIISPSHLVFIGFDGVAPFAKMEQQRNRRYKSWFMTTVKFDTVDQLNPFSVGDKTSKTGFHSAMITPGTEFMELLCIKINAHFSPKTTDTLQYIVTAADEPGEGEHKIFQHIRDNIGGLDKKDVALYGLDSDLIMLSIFHCFYTPIGEEYNPSNPQLNNIYIFREAPEFIKSAIPIGAKPANDKEPYFLDTRALSESILGEMVGNTQIDSSNIYRIYDYIFLCFFLGNDFLPHFPALNIRTHGINVLLDVYKEYIGNPNKTAFIINGKINWECLSNFIEKLSQKEYELILLEYSARDKFDRRIWSEKTAKEKETVFSNSPIINRAEEKYIMPRIKGWRERYYSTLFSINKNEDFEQNVRNICINYLEGLEWVFKYYTKGCADWRWKYNYYYPPLLTDLYKYIPRIDMDFITPNNNGPCIPQIQLAYVLPPKYHDLLPDLLKESLKKHENWYPKTLTFRWAFCRYFWESHVILPDITLEELEECV
jgi:5'-3' exonuclease